jgi:hypothetical protein
MEAKLRGEECKQGGKDSTPDEYTAIKHARRRGQVRDCVVREEENELRKGVIFLNWGLCPQAPGI